MDDEGRGGAHSNVFNLLGVLFVGLRLAGIIDWPWWAVLAPFWGQIVLVLVSLAVILWIEDRKQRKS